MNKMNTAPRIGFTLIELLVAVTLFISLMAITATAFQRISQGSRKSLQILELHTRADSILRYMQSDFRNMSHVSALHLQNTVEPYTITFMRPVSDTSFHDGSTEGSKDYYNSEPSRLTDLVWVRWVWEAGNVRRAQSRVNKSSVGDATYSYLKTLDLRASTPKGPQNNAVSPT